MENIPEADYEIVPRGTIRSVCLTRLSNPEYSLPSAKKCKIKTIYGIKDTNYEIEQFRFWRLRFYRTEYPSLTIREKFIILLNVILIYTILKFITQYIYSSCE